MLSMYLNEKTIYTPALRDKEGNQITDHHGQTLYGNPQQINCRTEPKAREIITADRQSIVTSTMYYLVVPVSVGDMLDGKRVLDVNDWTGLGGSSIGYEAVV